MSENITGKTQLIGLLATPISHSISPAMHNTAFAMLGLDFVYLAFDCNREKLGAAVEGLKAIKVRGFNLSMPNKTEIIKHLDKLSPAAKLSQAVNTVVNDNGILTGHNTDGTGYMLSLKDEGIDIIGKKMTIIGAGGAAIAICVQAALDGVKEISIFNRRGSSYNRSEEIIRRINEVTNCSVQVFNIEYTEKLRIEIRSSAILVNATPIGMKPFENMCCITDPTMLREDLIVSDLVYMPSRTKLLEIAQKRGCKIINGLGMLLWQGAKAFELWTGEEMPVEYVKKTVFKDYK